MIAWFKSWDRTEIILYTTVFLMASALSLNAPYFPPLATKRGLSPTQIGIISALEATFSFFNTFIWGKLLPKFGKKKGLILGLLSYGVGLAGQGSIYYIHNKWLFLVAAFAFSFINSFSTIIFLVNFSLVPLLYPRTMEHKIETMEGLETFGQIFGPMIGAGLQELGGYVCPYQTMCGVILLIYIPITIYVLDLTHVHEIEQLSMIVGEEVSQLVDEEEKQKKKEMGITALIFTPKVTMLYLFFLFSQAGYLSCFSFLAFYLMESFDLEQTKINYVFIMLGCCQLLALLFLKMFSLKKNTKTFIMVGGFLLSFVLIFIGPDKILTDWGLPKTPVTFMIALFWLNWGQGFIVVPTIPFWSSYLVKSFRFDRDKASDFASILMNSATIGGESLGPLLAGIIIDKYGFARCTGIWGVTEFGLTLITLGIVLYNEISYWLRKRKGKSQKDIKDKPILGELLDNPKISEGENDKIIHSLSLEIQKKGEHENPMHEKWKKITSKIESHLKHKKLEQQEDKDEPDLKKIEEADFHLNVEEVESEYKTSGDWIKMPRHLIRLRKDDKISMILASFDARMKPV